MFRVTNMRWHVYRLFLFLRAAEMQTFFGKGLFNVHAAVRQRPLAIEIVGMPLEKFQLLECIIH